MNDKNETERKLTICAKCGKVVPEVNMRYSCRECSREEVTIRGPWVLFGERLPGKKAGLWMATNNVLPVFVFNDLLDYVRPGDKVVVEITDEFSPSCTIYSIPRMVYKHDARYDNSFSCAIIKNRVPLGDSFKYEAYFNGIEDNPVYSDRELVKDPSLLKTLSEGGLAGHMYGEMYEAGDFVLYIDCKTHPEIMQLEQGIIFRKYTPYFPDDEEDEDE